MSEFLQTVVRMYAAGDRQYNFHGLDHVREGQVYQRRYMSYRHP